MIIYDRISICPAWPSRGFLLRTDLRMAGSHRGECKGWSRKTRHRISHCSSQATLQGQCSKAYTGGNNKKSLQCPVFWSFAWSGRTSSTFRSRSLWVWRRVYPRRTTDSQALSPDARCSEHGSKRRPRESTSSNQPLTSPWRSSISWFDQITHLRCKTLLLDSNFDYLQRAHII